MTAAAEPRLRLNFRALAFAALLPLGLALIVAGAVDAARVTGLKRRKAPTPDDWVGAFRVAG